MGCSTCCLFRVSPSWPEPCKCCQPRCGLRPIPALCPSVPGPSHAHFFTRWQLPAGRGLSGWQCWVLPLLPSPGSCPSASESTRLCCPPPASVSPPLILPAFGCLQVLPHGGVPIGLLFMGLHPEPAFVPLGQHPPPTQGILWAPGLDPVPGGAPWQCCPV